MSRMPENSADISDRDADRILADATELSFPRYPGTEGDRRAIDLVAGWMREAGLEVAEEEFSYDIRPAFRVLRSVLFGIGVLLAASGLSAISWPAVSGLLLLVAFAVGGFVLGWSPWSERLYACDGITRTANVVGRAGPSEKPRATIIVLAHHDSKSQNLTFPVRMGMTILALSGGLALSMWLLIRAFGADVPGPAWLPAAGGLTAAAALFVLSTLRSGNLSPGGVDNAGSVGIVLQLARCLPAASPDDVEWIFLSPGAEEDHMVGTMRWLDAHRQELEGRPVWALNFDGAGNPGRIALLERFGFGRWFSRHLSAVARRSAERLGVAVRGVLMPPAMGIDSIPFAHRGIDCLTFSSGSLGRATLAIHSAGDVAENLDRETLRLSAQLGADVALSLARDGSGD
ncbi:MAG: M28 family peptidase [bacterium]|nr:M28 family peptidase [bacterium]